MKRGSGYWNRLSTWSVVVPVSLILGLTPPTTGAASLISGRGPVAAGPCLASPGGAPSTCLILGGDRTEVNLPASANVCPNSSAAVACGGFNKSAFDKGFPSIPAGMDVCPVAPGQGQPAAPAVCTDSVLTPDANAASERIQLTAARDQAAAGEPVVLAATTTATVTGSDRVIEIFDSSTKALVGSCTQGSQCDIAYAARAGTHTFTAYLTSRTNPLATSGTAFATSNGVKVRWIGVSVTADRSAVGPGHPVDVTATSTIPVDRTGWLIQIYDAATRSRVGFCSSGSTCRTTLSISKSRQLALVGVVGPASESLPAGHVAIATSDVFTVTWLGVSVSAFTYDATVHGIVHVTASANTDLTNTGWTLAIFDANGQIVGRSCNTGAVCRADVTLQSSSLPSFKAAIGVVPANQGGRLGDLLRNVLPPAKLTNIQAESALTQTVVRPKVLWGVDSCKAFDGGLYGDVNGILGTPQFWGRYLTDTVCPALNSAEVGIAHNHGMGLLPIYNDFDCSAVVGYDVGRGYAGAAVGAARALGIPSGVALAVDIEAPGAACPGAGDIDPNFIAGWYDGVTGGGYVPAYYGNGAAGSPFANAYCAAVGADSRIGNNAHLWSYEPSLGDGFSKNNAPEFGAYNTGCAEHGTVWQYALSAGSNPDVDQDLLLSDFPLWYP